jgi:AAA+ superfamily predicted ATPase
MQKSQKQRNESYHYLKAEIAQIVAQIQLYHHKEDGQSLNSDDSPSNLSEEIKSEALDETPPPLALEHLCKCFDLNAQERTLLVICAGWEFDETLTDQYRPFVADHPSIFPSLRLFQKLVPNLDDSLLSPHSALQKFQLIRSISTDTLPPNSPLQGFQFIEVSSTDPLLPDSPLKIDISVLQYLLGHDYYDPYELTDDPTPKQSFEWVDHIPASYYENAEQLHALLTDKHVLNPIVKLCGLDPDANYQIATLACKNLGQDLYRLHPGSLFSRSSEDCSAFDNWLIWWHRRALLKDEVLFINCDRIPKLGSHRTVLLTEMTQTLTTPIILSSEEPLSKLAIPALAIHPISAEEQETAWHALLSNVEAETKLANLTKFASPLASQFNFDVLTIDSLCGLILGRIEADSLSKLEDINEQLWQDCRAEIYSDPGELAQKIESQPTWDELVLNDSSLEDLHILTEAARDRHKAYYDWRLGRSSERGTGMAALFYGLPGTGKKAATEIIAHDLGVNLYRVNLFWLSLEYVDDAEEKLERIFDAVEQTGAMLVLDEAESLIGQRADAKDFRDIHVNHRLGNYLLQRMEAHTGLTILITDQASTIDTAFTEQIDFKLWFEFPSLEQRVEIWKRMFRKAPTQGLSFQRLAQLNASGGLIRKIVMAGASSALSEGSRTEQEVEVFIQMRHLLKAAQRECAMEDKCITEEEVFGWV